MVFGAGIDSLDRGLAPGSRVELYDAAADGGVHGREGELVADRGDGTYDVVWSSPAHGQLH